MKVYDSRQHVCFECASLLRKYQIFKLKCCRAHEILSQISADNILTKQMILNVERKANKLESSLMFSSTEICCEPFNDYSNNSISNNVENPSHTFSDPLEIPVQPTEEDIPKQEFEPDVAMKCEEQINEELNFISKCDDVIDFSENGLEHSSDIPNEIEISESEQNCEDFGEIDVSLDAANGCLDNVKKSDLINLSVVAEKIPKIVNKLVNSKAEKCKSIFNKNTKNRKRKSEIVCNTNDFGTKISRKIRDTDKNLEEYLTIVSLSADEARNELLSRKESRVYKISAFKCEFCYKGYGNIVAYENHMKKHSIECGKFECDICHLRFPRERCVYTHKLSCHKKKFYCKLCPHICYNKGMAKNHVLNHKGTKYPCNVCGETFSKVYNLSRHKRHKHLNVCLEENVCEMCGDIFGPRGLILHLSILHRLEINKKEGPKCEECGVHFASEMAWKRHLVVSTKHIVHNGCKFCGETFSNDPDLKTHIRINHPTIRRIPVRRPPNKYVIKLPGDCPLCKKWLPGRTTYEQHMNEDHPQSEEARNLSQRKHKASKKLRPSESSSCVCEVCGKAYKLPSLLVYHLRKHTGERPYKCDDCGKAFAMLTNLNIHRTDAHLPKVPFKCDICAKVFANKRSLTSHIKSFHLGIRPHRCILCDKAFPHASDLKVHIKFVHGNEPYPKREKKRIRRRNVPKDSSS